VISFATEATQQESTHQLEHERRLGIFADRLFERLPSDLHDSYPRQKRLSIAASAFESLPRGLNRCSFACAPRR